MVTLGLAPDQADWPPGALTEADRARFARYAEAVAFYEGEQWLGKRRRGETRLTVNYARARRRGRWLLGHALVACPYAVNVSQLTS